MTRGRRQHSGRDWQAEVSVAEGQEGSWGSWSEPREEEQVMGRRVGLEPRAYGLC